MIRQINLFRRNVFFADKMHSVRAEAVLGRSPLLSGELLMVLLFYGSVLLFISPDETIIMQFFMKCTCGKCELGEIAFDFIYYFSDMELRDGILFFLASSGLMIQGTKDHFYVKVKLPCKICFN